MLAHKEIHIKFLQYGAAYGVNIDLQFIIPQEDLESVFFVNSFCATQFLSAVSLLFQLLQSDMIPGFFGGPQLLLHSSVQQSVCFR